MADESNLRTLCIPIRFRAYSRYSPQTMADGAKRKRWLFSKHHRKSVSQKWRTAKDITATANRGSVFRAIVFRRMCPFITDQSRLSMCRETPGLSGQKSRSARRDEIEPRPSSRSKAFVAKKKKTPLSFVADCSSVVFAELYQTSLWLRGESAARMRGVGLCTSPGTVRRTNEGMDRATNHGHPWPQCIHFSWSHSKLRLVLRRPRSGEDFQRHPIFRSTIKAGWTCVAHYPIKSFVGVSWSRMPAGLCLSFSHFFFKRSIRQEFEKF